MMAPDIQFTTTDDRILRLSDLRGKTVVLNFFATWCPACRAELPYLTALYNRYKGPDFALIAVGR